MEVQDTRAISGNKQDAPEVEINGSVAGFVPAFDRVLVKRLPKPAESINGIIRPEIMQEQAARGTVIAVGESAHPLPPVGAVASFSKFAEEKHFDDEGADEYALVWNVDIRGWHLARD
jgi:co-chaperonin GroES (HSP10)